MMKDDLAGASGGETSILFTSRLQRAGLLLVPRSLQLRLPVVRAIHATDAFSRNEPKNRAVIVSSSQLRGPIQIPLGTKE
jgi:hypothetical protein